MDGLPILEHSATVSSSGRAHLCCLMRKMAYDGRQRTNGDTMAASFSAQERREHFAYCVQLFGGTTAASRRLGIDERAIRRFINGERPLGAGLLNDTAKALQLLIAEATAAESQIVATQSSEPENP